MLYQVPYEKTVSHLVPKRMNGTRDCIAPLGLISNLGSAMQSRVPLKVVSFQWAFGMALIGTSRDRDLPKSLWIRAHFSRLSAKPKSDFGKSQFKLVLNIASDALHKKGIRPRPNPYFAIKNQPNLSWSP
jgi:hypothetical protein